MNLPIDFTQRMQKLLDAEADSFFKSYDEPKTYGLRINPLKTEGGVFAKALPFTLSPIAWTKEGFYALPDEHPGRHPLHESGAYYIQEPSAMSVVSLLDPQPGDIVCDLCAAPGGKSTQIAGRLMGHGLLVSNEIFPARAKILSQNIERFGVPNAIVCNEPPDRMSAHFPLFFNKIVVDAPCSGEGMFRKDDTAISEWSAEQVAVCAQRQKMILEHADQMLLPGGVMVYSTCTFAPEEDEDMVAWFLHTHPDYEVEDWKELLPTNCGLEGGRTDFLSETGKKLLSCVPNGSSAIERTLRLFPHKLKGEGHFAARLRKKGTLPSAAEAFPAADTRKGSSKEKKGKKSGKAGSLPDFTPFEAFSEHFLIMKQAPQIFQEPARYQYFGDALYRIPNRCPALDGIKVIRAGLHLGTRKKNRFEPAHALAMSLPPQAVVQSVSCDDVTAKRYLHGETIPCDTSFRGWALVTYCGISLGWGKAQNGILKNHYPKGLRTM